MAADAAAEAFGEPDACALCTHCGLPIPPGPRILARIRDVECLMCCVGCRAAAEMLESAGLGDWYARRQGPSGKAATLPSEVLERVAYLESQALEDEVVDRREDGCAETHLLVEGLRCAACVWVIERHLGAFDGVRTVRVSLASQRVFVAWDPDRHSLRDLIERLAEIGFAARPDRPGAQAELDQKESRDALIRLGIAGLGAMNVMTYAVALYFGAFADMSRGSEALMRWMGWLVSTPIVLISARPFFVGAWRDLARRQPGMDVPVALAIGGAYSVSALATITGTGEVYFDSVCMFTFFLGLGRYVEHQVKRRSASFIRERVDATPVMARRLETRDGTSEEVESVVAARTLAVGDRLRVRAGEAVPADGVVIRGSSAVDEALLSGEPWPRSVGAGDAVVAGSQNVDQTLVIEATRVGRGTTLAAVLALVERARSEHAPMARMADRVASYFVLAVLATATLNFLGWRWVAPEQAIWTTLSVLVATCPCALSLATPTAIASASEALARAGFLMANPRVLEVLARIDRFVFDKTGTLTLGRPQVVKILPSAGRTEQEVLGLARALERDSVHPIAHAFQAKTLAASGGLRPIPEALTVRDRRHRVGCGVQGWIRGERYRIGRPHWARGTGSSDPDPPWETPEDAALVWVLLSDETGDVAWFGLDDPERAGAEEMIEYFRRQGIEVEMLSGDPSPSASRMAKHLALSVHHEAASPEDKLARIQAIQESGQVVAVVGDGMNDSASLRAADISIAMGSGCDLTRLNADAVLLHDDLAVLPLAHDWARRTKSVISQNLGWAIGYNLIVLPLAISGWLAPWMAAIGMSTSSLVVVLNARRLREGRSPR